MRFSAWSDCNDRSRTACLSVVSALIVIGSLTFSSLTYGTTCDSIYSNGVQSHSSTGVVQLGYQSQILNGGSTLTTPTLKDNSSWPTSCGTSACTASGDFADPVPISIPVSSQSDGNIKVPYRGSRSFPAGNYGTVSLANESILTFTTSGGTYYTKSIDTQYRSKIVFSSGDYYIDGNLFLDNEVQLQQTGTGPIRLFISGSVRFSYLAGTSGIAPEDLLIYAKGDITFDQENPISGYIYSEQGNINIGYQTKITGAVSAAGTVSVAQEAVITYQALPATQDFGSFCTGGGSDPVVSSFDIDVGLSSASTCSPHSITITARDSDSQIMTDYTGTLTLATSSDNADWSKTSTAGDAQGVLSPGTADSGSASYTFDADSLDQGQVTLQLSNSHAQAVTISAADIAAGVSSTSSSLTFAENAFIVSMTESTLDDDMIAGRSHSMRVQMIRRDPVTGECGAAEAYDTASVKAWISRASSDPGAAEPSLTNANNDTVQLPSAKPAIANITFPFVDGTAHFYLLASDVGKYRLNILDSSGSFADGEISGGSSELVARPFGFAISIDGNPAATSATGSAFTPAGANFLVTVKAIGWQANDDNDDSGSPDGHNDSDPSNNASLTDNNVLTYFGRETPAESVTLTGALRLPVGGTDPGLGDGDPSSNDGRQIINFVNGVGTTDKVHFSEVGIIEVAASITSDGYLGQAAAKTLRTSSQSSQVGRFIPSHFSIQTQALEAACTQQLSFSYMGQTFHSEYDIHAWNALGGPAANYRDQFAKLDGVSLGAISVKAIDQTVPTPLNSRITAQQHDFGPWANGVARVRSGLVLQRDPTPEEPFEQLNIGVSVIDNDSVTVTSANEDMDSDNDATDDAVRLGATEVRYGRLILMDSFGPETADLPVRFGSEFWRDGFWQVNPDDDCTAIALTDITYNGQPISVTGNRTVAIAGGSTTGQYQQLSTTDVVLSAGDAGHYFTPPGAGNTGRLEVDVNLVNYPWLQFDWNDDGAYSDSVLPTATMTFGSYRGHDRIIHWREVLQ